MSNKTTFTVEGIAKLDISQVKQAAEQVKSSLQGVALPRNIDSNLASIFQKLNDEIAEFEVTSKKATTNADWSNVIKSGEKILGLYSKMEGQIRQLGDISESEMKALFPPEVTARIKKAEQAIRNYTDATDKNATAIKKQQEQVDKLAQKQNKATAKRNAEQGKTQVSNGEYAAMTKYAKDLGTTARDAAQDVEKLQAQYDQMIADRAGKRGRKPQALIDTEQALEQAKTAYAQATQAAQAFDQKMQSTTSPKILAELDKELNEATVNLDVAKQKLVELGQNDTASLNQLFTALSQIDGIDLSNVTHDLEGAKQAVENLTVDNIKQLAENLARVQSTVDGATPAMEKFRGYIDKTKTSIQDLNSMQSQVDQLKNSFMHFFSLTNGWMLLRRGIRQAYEAVKELDDAMTEIAVVSEYTLDDIWAMRDGYTKAASDMGASTLDLVNATKLYVQQGMDLQEAQEVGIETTKMARIANLDGAEATNLMTAALRGFNMEMNEANRVNDVYSQLAAKSAADTEEIATAMSKTASIAANAGASFENTSAFLTQIIETTREAPETAGTALKTIIARFQELKKAPSEIGEVDGEMVNANAIETALKTAGVELRNAQGEFRNFDEVIIELAGKWNSLDVMTQRYIATMAAGSRQQSRFIALMADSERLMELTGYAANSAGASNDQFNKTLDSLEAKINKLKNAWSLYLQNLANNKIIKGAVDILTLLLDTINNITATMPGFTGSIFQAILTFVAFKAAGALINKVFGKLGATFYSQGQVAGESYGKGVSAGLNKAARGISNTWKKIRALFTKDKWLGKDEINLKADPTALEPYKKAMINLEKAQDRRNQAANASNKIRRKSEKDVTSAIIARNAVLKTMGITEGDYNKLQALGLTQDQLDVALSNQDVRAKLLEIAATKGLSDEEKKAAIAQALVNKEAKIGILTRMGYILQILFGKVATDKDTNSKFKNAAATWMKAKADQGSTLAQWALNASMYACPLGWILLGILALVGALAIFALAVETDAEKMAKLKKRSEELGEAAREAEERLQAITETKDGLRELESAMDGLVKGTDEWTEQLLKVNGEVLDIIAKYPELSTEIEVDVNGALTIPDEEFDKIAQREQHTANTARIAQTYTNIELSSLETNAQTEDVLTSKYAIARKAIDPAIGEIVDADKTGAVGFSLGAMDALGGMTDWASQVQLDMAKAADSVWGRVFAGITTLGFSELRRAVDLGATGASSYEELVERQQNGGLSHAEFEKIALEAARQSIVATDGISEDERDKLEEIIDAENLDISVDDLIQQINLLGNSFDQLGNSAAAAANAQEAQRDAALRQIATDTGLASSEFVEQAIGMADVDSRFEDTAALIQEKKDELGSKNDDELKRAYAKQTGLTIDAINAKLEDKSLSIDTIRTALATESVNKEISDKMQMTVQTLEKMSTKSRTLSGDDKKKSDAFMNLLVDGGRGLTSKQLESLSGLSNAATSFDVDQELQKLYGKGVTLRSLGIDLETFKQNISNAQDTLEAAYAEAAKLGIQGPIEEAITALQTSVSGLELTTAQTKQLANAMTDIKVRGGDVDAFSSNIKGLLSNITNPKDLAQAQAMLVSTDFSSAQSIKDLANRISDMGYNIETGVVDSIIEASKASRRFDLAKLREEIESTMELIKDFRERERTDIEVDKETYQKIIAQSPELKTQFIFDGANYQYIGDDVRLIADILAKMLLIEQKAGIEDKRNAIEEGKNWENVAPKYQGLINKILDDEKWIEGEKVTSDSPSLLTTFLGDKVDSASIKELAQLVGVEVKEGDTTELIRQRLKESYENTYGGGTMLDALEAELEQLIEEFGGAQALISGTGWGVLASETNETTQGQALDALLKKQAGAMTLYQQLKDQYEKQSVDTEKYDRQIKALAVDLANLETEQDKLIQAITDGGEVLTDPKKTGTLEYNAALESIATILGDMFGPEGITESFMQNNKGLFAKLAEGGEDAKKAWKDLRIEIAKTQIAVLNTEYKTGAKNQEFVNSSSMPTIDPSKELNDEEVNKRLEEMATWFLEAGYSADEASRAVVRYAKALGYVGNIELKERFKGVKETAEGILVDYFDTEEEAKNNGFRVVGFEHRYDTQEAFFTEGSDKVPDELGAPKKDVWEEDYDWLYNLVQKQNKQLRERNKLEQENESILRKRVLDEDAYLANLNAQETILKEQNKLNETLLGKRRQEMAALQDRFSDISGTYGIYWDENTGQIHLPDSIVRGEYNGKISPKEGERIDQFISEMERVQGEMEDLEDEIADNTSALEEEKARRMESYEDIETRLTDALIADREKEIEAMEQMNELVSDAASELLDKIQTGIDDIRNAREMEEAETDIQDMEQRLALMRSDTSGANALDILKLEEDLEQARQDLMDNKIDQAIDELSRQNELAQKQREEQIELARNQFEEDQKNGNFAEAANRLLEKVVNEGSGSAVATSIKNMLKENEEYRAMGVAEREVYDNELNKTMAELKSGWIDTHTVSKDDMGKTINFTTKDGKTVTGKVTGEGQVTDSNGNVYTGIYQTPTNGYQQASSGEYKPKNPAPPTTETQTSGSEKPNSTIIAQVASAIINGSNNHHGWGKNPDRKKRLTEVFGATGAADVQKYINDYYAGKKKTVSGNHANSSYANMLNRYNKGEWTRYETGGLADFTGPAWLDGTKARPEYVLNAAQTQAFLKLVDVLGDFDGSSSTGGDNYYDVKIEVDELSNDYDVEQLMDKMKRLIADDASYRNVNAVDLGRR